MNGSGQTFVDVEIPAEKLQLPPANLFIWNWKTLDDKIQIKIDLYYKFYKGYEILVIYHNINELTCIEIVLDS